MHQNYYTTAEWYSFKIFRNPYTMSTVFKILMVTDIFPTKVAKIYKSKFYKSRNSYQHFFQRRNTKEVEG